MRLCIGFSKQFMGTFESSLWSKTSQIKCYQCDFVSVHKFNLRSHLKTHYDERSYKCIHCDYASIKKDTLVKHMKSHSEEKSFKCNQCDFVSAWSESLWRHLKIHTGEKSYKCNQCNYSGGIGIWVDTRRFTQEKYKCNQSDLAYFEAKTYMGTLD